MPQSLTQLYVHIIFSTKNRYPFIQKGVEQELYAYMGETITRLGGIPFKINGTNDHIHILTTLPRTVPISKLVEDIKRNSSRWIKGKGQIYQYFSWQRGYTALSVSPSVKTVTMKYIANQKEHHRKRTYTAELLEFLRRYNIQYDEQYLWD